MRRVILILEGEKPMSANKVYRLFGIKRNEEAQRCKQAVRAAIDPNTVEMFTVPVNIVLRTYFATRKLMLDSCNIPKKLYIDGLIGWLIKDDDYRYVAFSGATRAFLDPDNPRVEIAITPACDVCPECGGETEIKLLNVCRDCPDIGAIDASV